MAGGLQALPRRKLKEGNTASIKETKEDREAKINKLREMVNEVQGITEEEGYKLYQLLVENVDVFSERSGSFAGIECYLDTYEHQPFRERERPIPYNLRAAVRENIRKLLKDGVIECQGSEYNSAMVVIKKKNGDVRVCLDARRLNSILVPRQDSPARIEEAIKKFKGKNWLTSTDVTSGYFNVRLDDASKKYTAFTVNGLQYQYRVLPFGLKISGQMFIRCLEKCLSKEVKENAAIYVDDIVIGSSTLSQHMEHLKKLFRDIRASGIKLNLNKTNLVKKELEFVGYLVSAEGTKPIEKRLQQIQELDRPNTVKHLRRFIEFISYYRKLYLILQK